MSHDTLHVLFRKEEESWTGFVRRIRDSDGEVILVLSSADDSLLVKEEQRRMFLEECAKQRHRVRIATRHPFVAAASRKMGMRVYDSVRLVRQALTGHPQAEEAFRVFSPHLWRQKWRSRLQTIGLLSLPKVRIVTLILLSVGLFLFVFFRLLPSAEVRVWARGDTASQTMNFLLVQERSSGSTAGTHVRTLPLIPIIVTIRKSIMFDQIGKQFIGTSSEVAITIINKTNEEIPLKKGTRVQNQAGMIFRLQKKVYVPPNGKVTVSAKADTTDLYGEIIGERGNVPAGLRWDLPGLSAEEQKQLFAENRVPATGGRTAYRRVLQQSDLEIAKRRIEQELLALAKEKVQEQLMMMNLTSREKQLKIFTHDELIKATFTGFVLPMESLNQQVTSVPVEGGLIYQVMAYDVLSMIDILRKDLESHVMEEKQLISESIDVKNLDIRVFDYDDNLFWIKATAELTATEQFILDPLTPVGARFAKKIREQIVGLSKDEALRIIKNLPEVEKAEIKIWPPWNRGLPSIPSHISLTPQ